MQVSQPPTRVRKARQLASAFVWLTWLVTFVTVPARAAFKLLNLHSQMKVERIEKFVAADSFREGNRIGGHTLTAVGWYFKDHFLAVVEENIPETTLQGWTLLHAAGDTSIIEALGGETKAPLSSLGHVYRLMEMSRNGPSHVDWRSNFAYLRSPVDRRLWAIHWSMNYENEWTIGAVVVPHPVIDWPSGSRVFAGQRPDEGGF